MSDLNRLQGRIIALELLVRGLVAAAFANQADPLEDFAHHRKGLRASLQNVVRPIGDDEDATWEEAMNALEQHFDEIEGRIRRAIS